MLQVALAAVVVTAGVYDILYRRIPNWLVLIGLGLGFGLNVFLHGAAGLAQSGKGLGLAFLIYFPMYLLGGMGAGDVKLMGAIGSMVGPGNWFLIFLISAILGGVFALILIVAKRRFHKTLWNIGYILWEITHLRSPRGAGEELDIRSPKAVTLPHGAVIALGCLAFLGGRVFFLG